MKNKRKFGIISSEREDKRIKKCSINSSFDIEIKIVQGKV